MIFVFLFSDQTPTPTRFLKNCEEVGLFNELATSFEQDLGKTQDDEQRTKHTLRVIITDMFVFLWLLLHKTISAVDFHSFESLHLFICAFGP